jgi:hypothetical protein
MSAFDSVEEARVQRRGAKSATLPFANYFSYVRDFTRLRAYSVKSCATGVRVRFFTLMIANGLTDIRIRMSCSVMRRSMRSIS